MDTIRKMFSASPLAAVVFFLYVKYMPLFAHFLGFTGEREAIITHGLFIPLFFFLCIGTLRSYFRIQSEGHEKPQSHTIARRRRNTLIAGFIYLFFFCFLIYDVVSVL